MDHGIDHSTPRGHTPPKGHENHSGSPTVPWFQFLCMLLRPVTRLHIKTSIGCNPKALPILPEYSVADATISKTLRNVICRLAISKGKVNKMSSLPEVITNHFPTLALTGQCRLISFFVTLSKAKIGEKLPHSKGPIADRLFPNSLRYLEILSRASWRCGGGTATHQDVVPIEWPELLTADF